MDKSMKIWADGWRNTIVFLCQVSDGLLLERESNHLFNDSSKVLGE